MDLSLPPTPSQEVCPPRSRGGIGPFFGKYKFPSLLVTSPFFSLPIFNASEPLFGPKFGAFERPKSPRSIFQANL